MLRAYRGAATVGHQMRCDRHPRVDALGLGGNGAMRVSHGMTSIGEFEETRTTQFERVTDQILNPKPLILNPESSIPNPTP